ncbi:MAG: DMT family transporter [Pelagibacteraceae bacterium]|nr:DMT family transporter [Pelagibacteraceae bacterium]MBT3902386.1 DMT family transporter [Pelagibacteraceae bacterium]MBT4646231.1 DMT family transporter [Pelagibacteraceae bacterium]MBT4951506.1 DMT family transporter [Pelagibacteraceae bacterium]MBT5215006.1 DMT family transporter [Pelagibacteraceae bacterium]
MLRLFPLLFVFFWSSAFISGQIIVQSASPFASLSFRFIIVALGFLIFAYIFKDKILVKRKLIFQSAVTGIFFHGFYLGGVFFSFSVGLSATISALIVGLQPVLTNILSGPILNEKVSLIQWIGIFLGFIGTVLVIGFDIGNNIPIIGVIASIIALIGVTTATIWQKKFTNELSLTVNNFYQAIAASFFLFFLSIFLESSYINFTTSFILSMSWQIIMVSFGAFTILMYLIKVGSASKTSNLFFLVPPTTAIMAWLVLSEELYQNDILGLIIATIGVYVATRKQS